MDYVGAQIDPSGTTKDTYGPVTVPATLFYGLASKITMRTNPYPKDTSVTSATDPEPASKKDISPNEPVEVLAF